MVTRKAMLANEVAPDVYRRFGFPGAVDLGNMFQFKRDFEQDLKPVASVARIRRVAGRGRPGERELGRVAHDGG